MYSKITFKIYSLFLLVTYNLLPILTYSDKMQHKLLILMLHNFINGRAEECAYYIIEKNCTVREAAKALSISKSTVHKDVTERLSNLNHALYLRVKKILDNNLAERHIRGGLATRNKYIEIKVKGER